ncbi:MAG: hypothetical protein HY547_00810 [Elusimicrobia bacterium]|nr:hypothetical protein [Elusimicrobiota bacterium]
MGTWMVGQRMEFFRRGIRVREEHLEDIKQAVLEPILIQLKDYYLPEIQFQVGVLTTNSIVVRRETKSVSEDAIERIEYNLSPKNPGDAPWSSLGQMLETRKRIEDTARYYDDAKERHFPKLLVRWEKFRESFDRAVNDFFTYVSEIQKIVKKEIDLPDHNKNTSREPPWINYELLAIFIYERRLDIGEGHLRCEPEFSSFQEVKLARSNTTVARCAPQEAQKIIATIDRLVAENVGVAPLKKLFSGLEPEASALINAFRLQRTKKDLPSKCPLT